MNILHVIPGDLWAGAEAQVYYCLKTLKKKSNYDLNVVLFNEGELQERLLKEKIRVIMIDEKKCSSMAICRKLMYLIRKLNPTFIHVHEYKSHILATVAKTISGRETRVVRTLHGMTSPPQSGTAALKARLISWLEGEFLRRKTDQIIAVSEEIEQILKRKIQSEKVTRIPNAIETPLSISKSIEQIRREFNISKDVFWIGTAARLEPVKNLEMLIETARLLDHNMNYQISIFGEGTLKGRLQRTIAEYGLDGKVNVLGHYGDILPVFRALNVFVLTSHQEGLPISLLEAMEAGTVPVCTRVGGMKEVIEEENTGFLVEPGDAEALAQVFLFLYKNPEKRAAIAKNAKERIRKVYNVERSVDLLVDVYNRLNQRDE